jgi:anti-sigma regulatory factor (Ser/Thr protein kinase)
MLFPRAQKMATMELCADLNHLGAIRAFVRRALCEVGLDGSDVYDFTLAIDEICSNAIKHGNHGKQADSSFPSGR